MTRLCLKSLGNYVPINISHETITKPKGFKSYAYSKGALDGIETAHRIGKGQLSKENIFLDKQFMALAGQFSPQGAD